MKYETGANYRAYEDQSDRREYWEPCPECGGYQRLPAERGAFEDRFVVSETGRGSGPARPGSRGSRGTRGTERDPQVIRGQRLGCFVCEHCGVLISDRWQGWMSLRGVWVPAGGEVVEGLPLGDRDVVEVGSLAWKPDGSRWEPEVSGQAAVGDHRGYRLWAANLNSEGLSRQRTWSHMLAEWFEAEKSRNPERLQVFVNSWKCLPWKVTLAGLEERKILERKGAFAARVIPKDAKVVLASVDVQEEGGGYLVYDVWAFGPEPEAAAGGGESRSWSVDSGIEFVQHEDYQGALDRLYTRLMRGYPVAGESSLRMRPWAVAVDSGYRAREVYEFSRRPGVVVVKGQDDATYTLRMSEVEGKIRADPVTLWWVNTRAFKSRAHAMLTRPGDDPGGVRLHAETSEAWVSQMASEELKPKSKGGKPTWQLKTAGRANHHWDNFCYTLAVADALAEKGEVAVWSLRATDRRLGAFVPGVRLEPGGEPRRSRGGVSKPGRKRGRGASGVGVVEGSPV